MLSLCCGSKALGEIHNGIGFCGDCKDHAEFQDSCVMCGGDPDEGAGEDALCKGCTYF